MRLLHGDSHPDDSNQDKNYLNCLMAKDCEYFLGDHPLLINNNSRPVKHDRGKEQYLDNNGDTRVDTSGYF